MRYLVTLALLILGWSQASYAAHITIVPAKTDEDYAIVSIMVISLVDQDSTTFAGITEGVRKAIVFVSGPGGRVGPAIRIGRLIRERGFQRPHPSFRPAARRREAAI